MDKPYYEIQGVFSGEGIYETGGPAWEFRGNLEDALSFAKHNLSEYVIYMKMKIEEKKL